MKRLSISAATLFAIKLLCNPVSLKYSTLSLLKSQVTVAAAMSLPSTVYRSVSSSTTGESKTRLSDDFTDKDNSAQDNQAIAPSEMHWYEEVTSTMDTVSLPHFTADCFMYCCFIACSLFAYRVENTSRITQIRRMKLFLRL